MEYVEQVVRSQVWARAFFMGPTGSGKSRGALELGSRLFGGLPMTYINTEVDREKLYADRFKYGLIDLSRGGDFSPDVFVEALQLAGQKNPGGVIVLDSASQEWQGKNGCLNQAGRIGDWKTVRPKHEAFVEAIQHLNAHVIVCCRAKMKYLITEEEREGRKRQVVSMLGVGPIQDDGFQYEFNLVGRFDLETHEVVFSGHVDPLDGEVANLATDGDRVSDMYTTWLSEGTPIDVPVSASDDDITALVQSLLAEEISTAKIEERFAVAKKEGRGVLSPEYVAEQHAKSKERLARKQAARGVEQPPAAQQDAGAAPVSDAPAEPSEPVEAPAAT